MSVLSKFVVYVASFAVLLGACALLELSARFDAQLTGRENITLRGNLWGLSEVQIAELTPKVVEFAEIPR